MKKFIFALAILLVSSNYIFSVNILSEQALAESATTEAIASLGQTAPAFSATDSNGKTHTLSDFSGKYVVLEWLNHGCPYVRKHYDTGNMQKLQDYYTAKGVIWLSVASSAEGKQGHMTADEANKLIVEKNSKASAVLLDDTGTVGKLYGAKVTPHMFVISPQGKVIYAGGIDDNSSSRPSSVEGAKNYVALALDEAMAGKTVSVPQGETYGCSVKYKN